MTKLVGLALGACVLAAIACGSAKAPPPLTPDGPDMDLDAAVYQDDAPADPNSGL